MFRIARNPDPASKLPYLLFDLEHTRPGLVLDLVARLQIRYPNVPIAFCGTRKLAEEWTFRFLGAARAESLGELEWGDPTA